MYDFLVILEWGGGFPLELSISFPGENHSFLGQPSFLVHSFFGDLTLLKSDLNLAVALQDVLHEIDDSLAVGFDLDRGFGSDVVD